MQLSEPLGSQTEPLLRDLLALDASLKSETSVLEAFGDSFLVAKHGLYSALRREILDAGFDVDTRDCLAYVTYPLLALQSILTSRRLPGLPNRASVAALEAARPGFFSAKHLRMMPPRGNYFAHESAHAVAELSYETSNADAATVPQRVMRSLVGEAFANAVDALMMLECPADCDARAFLFLNCYFAGARLTLREGMDSLGALGFHREARKALVLAFVAANFGYINAADSHIAAIGRMSGLPNDEPTRLAVQTILAFAVGLSPFFTLGTNQVYLLVLGLNGSVEELTGFDPFAMLENSLTLTAWIDRLAGFLALHRAPEPLSPRRRAQGPAPREASGAS